MNITGHALIGGAEVRGTGNASQAFDPSRREKLEPLFFAVDAEQIDQACVLAQQAFDTFRALPDHERARFLDTVAEQIMAL
ncbi:MAG TPA: aldehyde dehydrogenase (NADP(+)), partial [Burkholderiaceae bacterium]